MNRRALVLAAVLLVVVLFAPANAAGDSLPTEGALTIAGYDADAYRADDHKSLSVSESYFFNNSGSEPFDGNITLWVQADAYISTRLCGSVRNQVARIDAAGIAGCLNLTDAGGGVYRVRPFGTGESLSYYGETHPFSLNATIRSTAANDRMPFNATVGATGVVPGELAFGNLTLLANDTGLGAVEPLTWGPPRNLTFVQGLEVTNTGSQDETVDLAAEGLPAGWTARLQAGGQTVASLSIPAGGTRTISLNVSAPSNIVHVFLEYSVPDANLPSGGSAVTIQKRFPYNTTYVLLFVYALENDVVSVTGDFELHSGRSWDANAGRYRYAVIGFDIPAGSAPTVAVTWVPPSFVVPPWAIAALAVLGAALIAYPVWVRRRRRREGADDESDEKPRFRPMTQAELRERRDTLQKTLDRLELDRREGGLPRDVHTDVEGETRSELDEVEQRLEILRSAEGRKSHVVGALRRLERDRKLGKVDKDVYASLKEGYEREGVKAMRQIDEALGNASKQGGSGP